MPTRKRKTGSQEGDGDGGGGEEEEEGRILSDYELQRLEKIRRNQAKLKELGLLSSSSSSRMAGGKTHTGTAKKSRPKRPSFTSPPRITRSRRTSPRLAAAALTAMMDSPRDKHDNDNDDDDDDDSQRMVAKPKRRRLLFSSPSSSSSCLPKPTAEMFPSDWLADMQDFLGRICDNSWTNVQRVMDKVEILSKGQGIRHPESHAYYCKNQKITPWDNVQVLLDEGHEWVEENGGDRGHGWLVTHPLRKLWLYQQWKQEQWALKSTTDDDDNNNNNDNDNDIDIDDNESDANE